MGCAYAPSRVPASVRPRPLPDELAAYYDSPRAQPEATVELLHERRHWREFLVQFPLAASTLEPTEPIVELEWFESSAPGRRPAIVFNPILGGDYPLERGVCRFLARHGFHVALIHRKTLKISPEHPASHLELLLRQAILRIRQVVDWMERQDRVDPTRMGSFGISMGGMLGVVAAAVEPRLRAHVVALAGGSIPDILASSRDRLLTKPRQRYLAFHDMDLAAFRRELGDHVKTDPLLLAPYVDSRRLFLFIAIADRTVGRSNALRLWRALGRPKAQFLLAGHYTAYLFLPYLKSAGLRFLQDQLASLP